MRCNNVPVRLKRKAFNECVLPVMTYGCETWSLINTQLKKLITSQRKMENPGRSHPERQNEYKLDPEIEWCDRHYQEHPRKQTEIVGPRGEET